MALLALAGFGYTMSQSERTETARPETFSIQQKGNQTEPDLCRKWSQANTKSFSALETNLRQVAQSKVIESGMAPGATIVAGCGKTVLASFGIGWTDWKNGQKPSPEDTMYDLASVTKLITTTTVLMLENERKLDLDDPVGKYLPAYRSGKKSEVTVRMGLQHRSGQDDPLYRTIIEGADSESEVVSRILANGLERQPGSAFDYSNLGFSTVWHAAGKAAGMPLDEYQKSRIFQLLDMQNTGYAKDAKGCAPTSPDRNSIYYEPGKIYECRTQDELAWAQGGESGAAGLFSTANDLGKFASVLATGGGPLLQAEDINYMKSPQKGHTYGLGALVNTNGTYGKQASEQTFGHTGHTGTGIFIDPTNGLWTVTLTNATYLQPAVGHQKNQLIAALNDTLAGHSTVLSAD